jgi:hypothetical protein
MSEKTTNLVVDDEPAMAAAAVRALKPAGLDVLRAARLQHNVMSMFP